MEGERRSTFKHSRSMRTSEGLLEATRESKEAFKPSARPLSKSRATIKKSLSGLSTVGSLWNLWWASRVLCTRRTQRSKTGGANVRNPSPNAVATDDRHSSKGNRSLSSSVSAFHLAIKGGYCVEIIWFIRPARNLPEKDEKKRKKDERR